MTKRITLKDGPAKGKTYLVPDTTTKLTLPSGEQYAVTKATAKLIAPPKAKPTTHPRTPNALADQSATTDNTGGGASQSLDP